MQITETDTKIQMRRYGAQQVSAVEMKLPHVATVPPGAPAS